MSIDLNAITALPEKALQLRARRHEVLATNIANADTPGYQARDIDFRAALAQAMAPAGSGGSGGSGSGTPGEAAVQYRNPWQPAKDGNTVEAPVEQAALAENAIQYQAALGFLKGEFSSLRLALTGNASGG